MSQAIAQFALGILQSLREVHSAQFNWMQSVQFIQHKNAQIRQLCQTFQRSETEIILLRMPIRPIRVSLDTNRMTAISALSWSFNRRFQLSRESCVDYGNPVPISAGWFHLMHRTLTWLRHANNWVHGHFRVEDASKTLCWASSPLMRIRTSKNLSF
jgi:hypothetical protein